MFDDEEVIFQDDNASSHRVKKVKVFLQSAVWILIWSKIYGGNKKKMKIKKTSL